jgi:hypothetical protein
MLRAQLATDVRGSRDGRDRAGMSGLPWRLGSVEIFQGFDRRASDRDLLGCACARDVFAMSFGGDGEVGALICSWDDCAHVRPPLLVGRWRVRNHARVGNQLCVPSRLVVSQRPRGALLGSCQPIPKRRCRYCGKRRTRGRRRSDTWFGHSWRWHIWQRVVCRLERRSLGRCSQSRFDAGGGGGTPRAAPGGTPAALRGCGRTWIASIVGTIGLPAVRS